MVCVCVCVCVCVVRTPYAPENFTKVSKIMSAIYALTVSIIILPEGVQGKKFKSYIYPVCFKKVFFEELSLDCILSFICIPPKRKNCWEGHHLYVGSPDPPPPPPKKKTSLLRFSAKF